jgi:hypothetical protein
MCIYNFSVFVTSCVGNGLVIGLTPPKGLYHVSINKILKHRNITPHTFVCSDVLEEDCKTPLMISFTVSH